MQLFIVLFAMLLRTTSPFSFGAPNSACGTMTPMHGAQPQTTDPPYSISAASSSVAQGDKIVVQIDSNGNKFKGFFVQAHDSSNSPIGTFYTSTHKAYACGDGTNNAVTHNGPTPKDKVTLEWEPPQGFEGNVIFKATVVETRTVFWTNLVSQSVSVVAKGGGVADSANAVDSASIGSAASTASTSTTTAPTTTRGLGGPDGTKIEGGAGIAGGTPSTGRPFPKSRKKGKAAGGGQSGAAATAHGVEELVTNAYNDCGTLKSCFGSPAQCVAPRTCKVLATFTKAGDKFEFELLGKRSNVGQYIAIAFGHDTIMGDDAVVVCSNEDGETDIYNTWNDDNDNIKVPEPHQGLTPLSIGFSDDSMYCSFRKDAKTSLFNHEFDFETKTYYIMVAAGSFSGGVLRYHGIFRLATDQPVTLGQTSKLSSKDDRLLKMVHGCLMVAAWVGAATCGMLFARYYKKTWLRFKLLKLDVWFQMHRFFMVSTWCLTVAAFIIIVYSLQKFRVSKHSIAGIFSVLFCFIQPFMAALRPHPGTPNRTVFNWLHWLVGNSAQILGIAAIFLGFELFLGSERNWVKELSWYILIAFIAYHILIHLMLTFSQCATDNKIKKKENEVTFPMKDVTDSRLPLQPEVRLDAPMTGLRKFILAIYLPVNWLATGLLIVFLVAKAEDIEATLTSWGIEDFWTEIEAE